MEHPTYFDLIDHRRLLWDYPLGDDFLKRRSRISKDELRDFQEKQFQSCVERAWQIPFYQRLWGQQGIERGDIQGLDNLLQLPSYDKSDIMRSVEEYPGSTKYSHGKGFYSSGIRSR